MRDKDPSNSSLVRRIEALLGLHECGALTPRIPNLPISLLKDALEEIELLQKHVNAPGVPSSERCVHDVAGWMMKNGYVTGHCDTLDDLLNELVLGVSGRMRKTLREISEMRWKEDADLDDICTLADGALDDVGSGDKQP